MLEFDFEFDVPAKKRVRAHGKLAPNERVALSGPSGCGKSTFLKALLQLESPINGFITLNSKPLNRALLNEGVASFAFQSSPLLPHLSVLENLMLPLKLLKKFSNWGISLQEKRAEEFLARANISALKNKTPTQLSGGEKKRVSLLRSLVNNPDLLILDEPFSDIDVANRSLFQQLLLEWAPGKILLFVTHHHDDLSFASRQVDWPQAGNTLEF